MYGGVGGVTGAIPLPRPDLDFTVIFNLQKALQLTEYVRELQDEI